MDFTRTDKSITDEATDEEALSACASKVAFGVINDEGAFYELVRIYDELQGRPTQSSYDITSITNDRTRSWYLYLTSLLLHETRFNITELLNVVQHMRQRMLFDRDGKRKKRPHFVHVRNIYTTIYSFCQYPDFEPSWHMRMRGDDRRLPNDKGRDLWGFLNRMYMDPEYCRMRVPDYIKKLYSMYPGYEGCLKAAIKDGQEEMKRIYGQDVDLSPVTDIKKNDGVDYASMGSSFMTILRSSQQ